MHAVVFLPFFWFWGGEVAGFCAPSEGEVLCGYHDYYDCWCDDEGGCGSCCYCGEEAAVEGCSEECCCVELGCEVGGEQAYSGFSGACCVVEDCVEAEEDWGLDDC